MKNVMKGIKELEEIGLTPGEAKVYLALIEIGVSTVGSIVKKSGIAYSNIYDVLNRLIEKGLVSYVLKSKTKYFQASNPKNFLDYFNKKEQELKSQQEQFNSIIPLLEGLQQSSPKEEVELFVGTKGLRTAYEKLFSHLKKDEENLFFYIHDEKYGDQADSFYFSIQDIIKKYKTRGVCNEKGRKSEFNKKAKYAKIRYANFPIPGNMEVGGERLLIISWEKLIIGILIHSPNIAENFRTYFLEAWNKSKV